MTLLRQRHCRGIVQNLKKEKKERKAKPKNRIGDSQWSQADNSYTVQYNHDRLVIVKRRSEKYSLHLATGRRQRRCIHIHSYMNKL